MSRSERLKSLIFQKYPSPEHFRIEDESQNHSRGLETHYKIILVSAGFSGVSRVQRQRSVMSLFKAEMDQGLHSVTLKLMTPEEFQERGGDLVSPTCAGASGDKV